VDVDNKPTVNLRWTRCCFGNQMGDWCLLVRDFDALIIQGSLRIDVSKS